MRQVAPEGARTGGGRPSQEELQVLFRRMRWSADVTTASEAAISDMFQKTERIREYRIALRRGQSVDQSVLVIEGLICRYRDFPNGARQITALYVPGDFVDLASYTLKRTDQDVLALTNCTLAVAPHEAIAGTLEREPGLATLLWLMTSIDANVSREWELSLGQRNALERTAHLFCELHARLELVGLADKTSFALPLTQVELSQCLAISPVHANRVLRELRERHLLQFSRRTVQIDDPAGLRKLAGFDPAYLHVIRQA